MTNPTSNSIDAELDFLKSINCFASKDDFQSENWTAWNQYATWYMNNIKATCLGLATTDQELCRMLWLLLSPSKPPTTTQAPSRPSPNALDIVSILRTVASSLRRGNSSMAEILETLQNREDGCMLNEPGERGNSRESHCSLESPHHQLSLPVADKNAPESEGSRACQALFIVMSWMLMLFTPACNPPPGWLYMQLTDPKDNKKTLRSNCWEQFSCPINRDLAGLRFEYLLNHFGQLKFQQLPSRVVGQEVPIAASNVNYFILSKVAKIRVVWVDALSLHLEFDRRTSTLKLFRFPSFCAMLAIPRASKVTIFDHLFKSSQGDFESINTQAHASSSHLAPYSQDFFVEVLCSLRLIFGQNARSRDLYKKLSRQASGLGCSVDPLREQICSAPSHHCTLFDQIDAFPEKSIYSAQFDFPYLGKRLLELQDFVVAQNPGDLRTLVYDVRDLNRYMTFWAVIVFGIASIILAVIQTILTGLQLKNS